MQLIFIKMVDKIGLNIKMDIFVENVTTKLFIKTEIRKKDKIMTRVCFRQVFVNSI